MLEGKRSADVFAIYYQHARPMIVINLPSSVQHCFTLALPSKISFTLILRCSALCRACLVMHCSTCFLHLRTLLSLRVCHLRKSLSEFIFSTILWLIYSKHTADVCGVWREFFILCTNFSEPDTWTIIHKSCSTALRCVSRSATASHAHTLPAQQAVLTS